MQLLKEVNKIELNKEIKQRGIYAIINKKTNTIYIGKSKNIHARWTQHKSTQALKTQPDFELYKDFLKYGVENFIFKILEICEEKELQEREQYFIDLFDAKNLGYNNIMAIDKKEKELNRKFRRNDISESVYRGKEIICVNDKKIFFTIRSASKYYSVDPSNVSKVIAGKRKHTKNLVFREIQRQNTKKGFKYTAA